MICLALSVFREVWLFGSVVRHEDDERSDIDVAVVIDARPPQIDAVSDNLPDRLREPARRLGLKVSLIALSAFDLERQRGRRPPEEGGRLPRTDPHRFQAHRELEDPDVIGSNAILAAIAHADAVTIAVIGEVNQTDHAMVAKLVRTALGNRFPRATSTCSADGRGRSPQNSAARSPPPHPPTQTPETHRPLPPHRPSNDTHSCDHPARPEPPEPKPLLRRQLAARAAAASLLATIRLPQARAAQPKSDHPAPAPGPFDGSTVRDLARNLARHRYETPSTKLPDAVAHLDFDAYRGIRYRKDHALWAGQNLRFTAEFLPRGFLFPERVDMFEVAGGQATLVPYSPDVFDYADPKLRVPDSLGYSGFRLHTPLNRQDYYDEVCVFQGASYFRAVARGQTYGISARGLAIGTGDPKGEEFARFAAFWLEKPEPGADSIVVHALLDSRSATGAFRFTIRPGQETVFDTETTLYPRTDITEAGIAPLTGMFDFDANNKNRFDDWRPAAHDSDGLSFWTGAGEQIWRPLDNPVDLQFSAFGDTNPHGFGMMQRKRAFLDYQDLALDYQKRPSLFIEPVGAWNTGFVDLIELPSINEVNDNMVAFWRPRDKLAAGGEYAWTYRMHWCWDGPLATELGRAVDTRVGAGEDRDTREFVIDFSGKQVATLPADAKIRLDLGTSKGQLSRVVAEPNPNVGGWRVMFQLAPAGEKLVEMHARILDEQGAPLTETWIYRWTP